MSEISRRAFLDLSLKTFLATMVPKELIDILNPEENEPLTRLPVLVTHDAPVFIEHLSRGGNKIDLTLPGTEMYSPDRIIVSGMPFDLLSPFYPDPDTQEDGNIAWIANLPHVTGLQPIIPKIVIGWGDMLSVHKINGQIQSKQLGEFISTYAFCDRIRIYPAKIYNILTALASISEWEMTKGPLMPGKEYSYLVMTGAPDRTAERFLKGGYLDAGGICASVATVSKSIFIAQATNTAEITRRFLHKPEIQYAENPGDPAITKANSDATVGWAPGSSADSPWSADLRFKIAETAKPLYLSFSAHVKHDFIPIDITASSRHRRQPADARLTFTVSLVTAKPNLREEITNLLRLRDEYAKFHNFDDKFDGGFNDK